MKMKTVMELESFMERSHIETAGELEEIFKQNTDLSSVDMVDKLAQVEAEKDAAINLINLLDAKGYVTGLGHMLIRAWREDQKQTNLKDSKYA